MTVIITKEALFSDDDRHFQRPAKKCYMLLLSEACEPDISHSHIKGAGEDWIGYGKRIDVGCQEVELFALLRFGSSS